MKRAYAVTVAGTTKDVSVEPLEDGRTKVRVGDVERVLDVREASGRLTWLDGTTVVTADVEGAPGKVAVSLRGHSFVAEVADASRLRATAAGRAAGGGAGPAQLRSTMPGRIVKVLARVGDEVKAGAGLVVIEAMKMENEIRAPRAGIVRQISVIEGAAVEAAQDLVLLDPLPQRE